MSTTLPEALGLIAKNINLSAAQMQQVMRLIMQGQASDAQIGAWLMGLRLKGESIEEITAAAQIMRELSLKIDVGELPNLVDIVGTGGDGQNLFNVSSAATFVMAAAGANVAKHGNRGVSSKSGSSDVLEQAGIRLDLNLLQTERCIREIGVGFLFAPNHHPAMKYAVNARREIGIRSIFNLLGPLTNPAGVKRYVLGVFSPDLCHPMAEVMQQLGAEHVMVVHAQDGLDEISLASPTQVAELKQGQIQEWQLTPEMVGITSQSLAGLSVDGPAQSLKLIQQALARTDQNKSELAHKAADMIALNAGAGLYVAGVTADYAQGVALARDILDGGQAREKMSVLAEFTQTLKQIEQNP